MWPLEPRFQKPGFSLGEPSKVKYNTPRESEDSAGLVFALLIVASDSASRRQLSFSALAEDLSGSFARRAMDAWDEPEDDIRS